MLETLRVCPIDIDIYMYAMALCLYARLSVCLSVRLS